MFFSATAYANAKVKLSKFACSFSHERRRSSGARMSNQLGKESIEYSFGPFKLVPARRSLTRRASPVRLEGRAFDLLVALVANAGRVVLKGELTQAVWPDVHVSDGSLRVHLVEIRKVLGPTPDGGDYVSTVRGRGYSFVAPVRTDSTEAARLDRGRANVRRRPSRAPAVFGRAEACLEMSALLNEHRFLTVAGPGGVGKTTAALAVAEQIEAQFTEMIFVDLGAVASPYNVLDAIAVAAGLAERGRDPDYVVDALSGLGALLVLDGCEHLTPYLAPVLGALAARPSQTVVLATSREPIGYAAEVVFRLHPLPTPGPDGSSAAIAAAPSVQLLFERMRAAGATFMPGEEAIRLAGRVCAAVSGLPLAIELIAANASALGLPATAEALFQAPLLPGFSRARSGADLASTLEWSYRLLSPDEAGAFRRLSVFSGDFPLSLAAVLLDDRAPDPLVGALIVQRLASKSLLSVQDGGAEPTYRLLDTTRSFGRKKLDESGETRATWTRVAAELRRRLSGASSELERFRRPADMDTLRICANDVDAALTWCFGSDGDRALGVALATVAGAFFEEIARFRDAENWSRTALAELSTVPAEPLARAKLNASLGASLYQTSGRFEEAQHLLEEALELARSHNAGLLTVRASLWLALLENARDHYKAGLLRAGDARVPAAESGDPLVQGIVESCVLWLSHWSGAQRVAYELGSRTFDTETPHGSARQMSRVAQSAYFRAKSGWARALWLVGRAEKATEVADAVTAELDRADDPSAIATSLLSLSTIFAWVGDDEKCFALAERAYSLGRRHGLTPLFAMADAGRGLYLVRAGEPEKGVPLLQGALETMARGDHRYQTILLRAYLSDGLARLHRYEEAIAIIDSVTVGLDGEEMSFASPEAFRIKGTILEIAPGVSDDEIWAAYQSSLHMARQQGALAYELRTGLSFGRFLIRRGRAAEALALVKPLYAQFTEGFESRDVAAARALIEELEHTPAAASVVLQ
jgi:predicted ATPase/DNA-binding winged helix-turn-helix (wHTH) protein